MRAVNLIPSSERRGGGGGYGRSGGAAYVLIGLFCGIALLTLAFALAHRQIGSRKAQAETLTVQSEQAQAQAASLSGYTNFIAMHDQREQALVQLAGSRLDWGHAMHEIGRVLPLDVSLTSITGTIVAGTAPVAATPAATTPTPATTPAAASVSSATSATPPGSIPTIVLDGCTTSQSEVALTMQRLALADGVTNVALNTSAGAATDTGTASSSSSSSASSGASYCPFNFAITLTYAGLPAVSTTTASATSPTSTTASTSTPATGATTSTPATGTTTSGAAG
jgi:hypothetical protein